MASTHEPDRPLASTLYLLPVILLWAATPVLVTEMARTLSVFQITWMATGSSTVVMAAITTVTGRWSRFPARAPREWATMLLMGATGIFPYTVLYYLAFSLAPQAAGSVNIVNYLWPVWVVILSVPVLRESLTARKMLGVLLSFAGVYLVISGGRLLRPDPLHLPAYLSAGAGALFWGLFSVLTKRHRFEPFTAMLFYDLGALLPFTAAALLAGGLRGPSPRDWLLAVLLGGGANGVAYVFWTLALRTGDTARVSALVYLVPFVALGYLYLLGGIPIRPLQVAALCLVVTGPLIQRLGRSSRRGGKP